MKTKYFKIGLLFAAIATMLTACESDRDANPVIGPENAPTTFVLNTPAMAEQFIQLTKENKVNLTWSQPNYAYNPIVTYQIQVGLVSGGNTTWCTDDQGNNVFLDKSFSTCNANIGGDEIAEAICKIDGFAKPEDYVDKGIREIAMRVRATVRDQVNKVVSGTEIFSNAVSFKNMAAYNAVKGKGKIWLIGDCSGSWIEPSESKAADLEPWMLEETEIGSKIYKGTFDMPAGVTFRFYAKLTGWDGGDSYGHQVDDNATDFQFSGSSFSEKYVKGKGSWHFPDFAGGKMTITIDMDKETVKFEIE
jgi:hypothetical protein